MLVVTYIWAADHEEPATRWIDEQFVPVLRQQPGFAGFQFGAVSRDYGGGESQSITRWQTLEQARRMSSMLRATRREREENEELAGPLADVLSQAPIPFGSIQGAGIYEELRFI